MADDNPYCYACGQATVDTLYNGFDYCDPCREHECLDLDDDGGQPHDHGEASDDALHEWLVAVFGHKPPDSAPPSNPPADSAETPSSIGSSGDAK